MTTYADTITKQPLAYEAIDADSRAIGFSMPSDLQTGALLQTLAASRPGGRLLEIGTGTGLATAWLLNGMRDDATLVSLDSDATYQAIAARQLGHDTRLDLVCTDATEWLATYADEPFDLIFADAWPGKYSHLNETLALLKPGGMYVIDDMLPQPNWPHGHQHYVDQLVESLEQRSDIQLVKLAWSTGLMLVVKK